MGKPQVESYTVVVGSLVSVRAALNEASARRWQAVWKGPGCDQVELGAAWRRLRRAAAREGERDPLTVKELRRAPRSLRATKEVGSVLWHPRHPPKLPNIGLQELADICASAERGAS